MLPEQALHSQFINSATRQVIQRGDEFADRVPENLRTVLRWLARITTLEQLNTQPHTLTGDEWRTARAEAHDAETDAALDAVY